MSERVQHIPAETGVPWDLLPPRGMPLPGNGVTISDSANRIFAAMGKASPPTTFYRGGAVVEIDADGAIRPLADAEFSSRMERCGITLALRRAKDELVWTPRECSASDAKLILATLEARELLPPLTQVVSSPLAIEENGELRVLGAGYHRALGGVLVRAGKITDADLPPTDEAAQMLVDLLEDFAFVDAGDRSRAIAALIGPALQFGRHLVDTIPFDVSEADQSQAGKGFRAKLVGALYGETLATLAQSKGGVGGLDEAFSSAVAAGRPFVLLDNLRGSVDSQTIEAFATATSFQARGPYAKPVTVDPRKFVIFATSNGVAATRDFANRASIVRIRKRPAAHVFRQWPEGDVLAHLQAHRMRYLAAVFAIIREWISRGKPRSFPQPPHDRREWAAVLDWIAQNIFCSAPLLAGHQAAQERVSNPRLVWLREVALAVERCGRLGDQLSASNLAELCESEGLDIIGHRTGEPKLTIGRTMGALFRGLDDEGCVSVDAFVCVKGSKWEDRATTESGARNGVQEITTYTFTRGSVSI